MRAAAGLLALLLAGCLASAPVVPPQASVAVVVPIPEPPAKNRPLLPAAQITDKTSDADTVKLYAATVKVLTDYATSLEQIIDGYRPKPAPP